MSYDAIDLNFYFSPMRQPNAHVHVHIYMHIVGVEEGGWTTECNATRNIIHALLLISIT